MGLKGKYIGENEVILKFRINLYNRYYYDEYSYKFENKERKDMFIEQVIRGRENTKKRKVVSIKTNEGEFSLMKKSSAINH